MRSFASDNNSGVHPLVMEALVKANKDHAVGYGDDPWTIEAENKIKEVFGIDAYPFFVFNGTGANSVAIHACVRPFDAILCSRTAHINVDECGAPSKMAGCSLIPIDTPDGKLTTDLIKPYLKNFGECHHAQPKVVYISNVSELGTIYTLEQISEIASLIHKHGMYLHIDGARLANACVRLGCTMKEITVGAGADILSFGGTKNGMMMGEAVISFRNELTENLKYIRKQSAQLASKQRYLAAQFIPYFENNLWYKNAKNANDMAEKLAEMLRKHSGVVFTQKPESNQLFFTAPDDLIDKIKRQYFFYFWDQEKREIRLVTSWDTTDADLKAFERVLF